MSLFGKRRGGQSNQAPAEITPVDAALPDDAWWQASEAAFRDRVKAYFGSPETMRDGGQDSYGYQDFGTATLFFAKAIDMLHTAYGFNGMNSRQPSAADTSIVDGFTAALGASRTLHPHAPVEECVREVTHRLRSISTECERVGVPSTLYQNALHRIDELTPDVWKADVRSS